MLVFLAVYCQNRDDSDLVPVADFDVVRDEFVDSVHIDSLRFDTSRFVCSWFFYSQRIYTSLLHCIVYLLVVSPMFRTDLIAHLQGTGIDSW